ncbi:MAG: helix-turn-helix transcriptional regulator [Acidobacteria bacterium]|nr:helix-turn-helix transcriptional regulator [Acidobacteriota bacterium]
MSVRGFIPDPGASGSRVAVSTHDRAEATRLLRRSYPRLSVEVAASTAPFVFRQSAFGDGRIVSTELMLAGAARASGSFHDGSVAVGEVLAGGLSAEYPRLRIDTDQPFLQPSGPGRMHLDDLHLRMTVLDAEAFRRAAERYEHDGAHHRLARSAPVSVAAGAAWRWTATHIQRSVRDPRTLDNPIIAGELFDLAVRSLLSCFAEPSEHRDSGDISAAPRAVRRAVAYLEEHALDSVSIPDVADAARISVRSLQALFRRHLGVSPVEHLHAIRLEAARRDLLRGEGASVHAVAERWGFGNSGRFARLYQQRFGERPSATLRAQR